MEEESDYIVNTGVESDFKGSGLYGGYWYDATESADYMPPTRKEKFMEWIQGSKAGYWYYRIKNTIDYAINYDERDEY